MIWFGIKYPEEERSLDESTVDEKAIVSCAIDV